MTTFSAPKGTSDVLPEDSGQWSETVERLLAPSVRAGYRLASLRAFDAFPMTAHVECVALLEPALLEPARAP